MGVIAGQGMQANPFVILTFIVAPAILTNASALMVLSTSNRFARAIDRARELSRQIESVRKSDDLSALDRLESEVLNTEKRAVLLLKSLRSFYFSLGCFAFAASISLFGAGVVNLVSVPVQRFLATCGVASVFLAVGGLVSGSVLLFSETRITVGIIQDRIKRLNEHHHFADSGL